MNKGYILRMKSNKTNGVSSPAAAAAVGRGSEWEVRPGGMLVQKRNSDCNQNSNNIKVRVKYGSVYHEVVINSQASFGELKKMVAGPTGLHTEDQKVIYKEKERDSRSFLDNAGVRDGSKVVVVEDELSRERRCLQSRKNATLEKASKQISSIRFDVDNLAKQVASIELEINVGNKVVEAVLLSLIELLMTQLIKLDAIAADGEVKRVQKYIETLDVLKMRNSNIEKAQLQYQHHRHRILPKTFQNRQEIKKTGNFNSGQVVVTTKWETF